MSETVKHQTESNRDAHDLIERAKKFSVRLPVVGTVRVPPPDQLAFYGALGIFAALNVIDWRWRWRWPLARARLCWPGICG